MHNTSMIPIASLAAAFTLALGLLACGPGGNGAVGLPPNPTADTNGAQDASAETLEDVTPDAVETGETSDVGTADTVSDGALDDLMALANYNA